MTKIADFERNGILWVYDAGRDDVRPATQKDIDGLQVVANAYGMLKENIAAETRRVSEWEREKNPLSPKYKGFATVESSD